MIKVRQTALFKSWHKKLRDVRARAHITRRIENVEMGNMGKVKSLGDKVSEMKINYGPGYRLYYTKRGNELIILLCGGDKGSQNTDIRAAKKIAKDI